MNPQNDYIYATIGFIPELPFDIRLSFEMVFQFWEGKAKNGSPAERDYAQSILDQVSHAKELRTSFSDVSLIQKYAPEIQLLLSALFPEILTRNEIKAASLPFYPVLFNRTERFKGILNNAGKDFTLQYKGVDKDEFYVMASSFLISMLYKIPINNKRAIYFDIPNEKEGYSKHYRAIINADFSKFTSKPDTKPLTPEDVELLVNNIQDVELWKEKIPPGSYTYEGFAVISLFDQTEDEALSELKQLLLESQALQNEATLDKLQVNLAQYLNVDSVELGFEAFDAKSCSLQALHGSIRPSKLLGEAVESAVGDCFCDRSADLLLNKKEVFTIPNVRDMKSVPSHIIKRMYDQGVGSFIVAPLKYNNQVIAFIELTSPTQGVLNSMVANKLKYVLPLFTVAVGRSIENHQTQLEAIIQDKFTTIHPTVNWKFMKSAESIFHQRSLRKAEEIEEINFQDVYPLYGQFDIRGSSDARNASIQADLQEQLEMAGKVLQKAVKIHRLPIFQQLQFRIDQFRTALGQAIHAGDEVKILDFMQRELDPVFDFLETKKDMKPMVKEYRKTLDPNLGVIYRLRKEYESSVTMINERISEYIDQQQEYAQGMFPHYFEKYKTDGVEYNAYIGQSLVQAEVFHPLHLKNLRLWQLLITCGVENLHQSYKDELMMPLEITSLILAHSNALAIRFRMDEKRFDVDGAYNIRYEILKKRIDKAYIKGTTERLTQPGKLSIVYSQEWEADEYLQYIQYLQSIGYLDSNLERLDLQDLQGTSGLQALRVGFNYEVSPDKLIQEMMQEVAVRS